MSHHSQNAAVILPDYNEFTGFVFKLQANLDPRHRDRLAYVRVVSGRYEKGMKVREGRKERGGGLARLSVSSVQVQLVNQTKRLN